MNLKNFALLLGLFITTSVVCEAELAPLQENQNTAQEEVLEETPIFLTNEDKETIMRADMEARLMAVRHLIEKGRVSSEQHKTLLIKRYQQMPAETQQRFCAELTSVAKALQTKQEKAN